MLAGADALRARELTIALPPVCRATSAEGEPSATIVGDALDALTDAAVRTRLSAAPGFELLAAGAAAPLTDRWAAALTSPDALLSVAPGELAHAAQLAFVLWAWQDAAQEPPGPVRTCFRLIEPDRAESRDSAESADGAERGTVPRPRALPSRQAPPSRLSPRGRCSSRFSRPTIRACSCRPPTSGPASPPMAGPRRASATPRTICWPASAGRPGSSRSSTASYRGAAPASVDLDTRGALRFLKETGPLLAAAGFGVLLPDWVRRSRLGLKLTTRSRTATGPGSVTRAEVRPG